MRILAFALVFFIAYACAEQLWVLPTSGPIDARPVFFDDKMAIGSGDGTVSYLYPQTGSLIKRVSIGKPVEYLKLGGGFLVAASEDSISILDRSGTLISTVNETTVYGIGTDDSRIYAATDQGLMVYDYAGNMVWNVPEKGEQLGEPLVEQDRIIFASGSDIVVLAKNGSEINRVKVAASWKSRPAEYNDVVYMGSTDGKMYAVSLGSGKTLWTFETGAWIMSDPLYSNGTLYFGSNNGYLYALRGTGQLLWKTGTPEAIQGGMELASLGGRDVIITGSNSNRVYAMDAKTGDVVLSFSVGGWVHNPAFNSNRLYFGSYDGYAYSYTADRSCTIESPSPGENVGYIGFNVSGRVFSQYTGARAQVRVNNQSWQEAQVSGANWQLELDPNQYDFGRMFIECRAADSVGQESRSYSYVVILRDINAQKEKMTIASPTSVVQGRDFQVKAYASSWAPICDFSVVVEKKTFQARNCTATVRVDETGTFNMLVRKTGYTDELVVLNSGYDVVMIASVAVTIIAVLGAAFYLFVYKKR
ncbi:MAG: PQQ-binding-like beta-propeller repeat protein [Candidatus ainarchaeum sp.]|nr:PQQ-binding-like beta-propeller repeat protein [Candidatus ainarchaeum sp.]